MLSGATMLSACWEHLPAVVEARVGGATSSSATSTFASVEEQLWGARIAVGSAQPICPSPLLLHSFPFPPLCSLHAPVGRRSGGPKALWMEKRWGPCTPCSVANPPSGTLDVPCGRGGGNTS